MRASVRQPAPPKENSVLMGLDLTLRRPHARLKQRVHNPLPPALLAVRIRFRSLGDWVGRRACVPLDNCFVSDC
jgi:hypothetical protein